MTLAVVALVLLAAAGGTGVVVGGAAQQQRDTAVVAGIDGDPAIETVPVGTGTVAPAPIIPQASPGAKPAPVRGHESHTAPPPAPIKEPTPGITPTASPTA